MPRQFTSTRGGVMTVEAGSITGDLELATEDSEGRIEVYVRYAGAAEWYTVEGSPVTNEAFATSNIEDGILSLLTTPGEKQGFNESPCSLSSIG